MPTDRHTATGTCEIGHVRNKGFSGSAQDFWLQRSALGQERLDLFGMAHERDHHGGAEDEGDGLNDVDAVDAEVDRPGSPQPPAEAAPNTPAPIKTAAPTTLSTF